MVGSSRGLFEGAIPEFTWRLVGNSRCIAIFFGGNTNCLMTILISQVFPVLVRCYKAQLRTLNALRYKPAGRGFDSRWCHWNFSVT